MSVDTNAKYGTVKSVRGGSGNHPRGHDPRCALKCADPMLVTAGATAMRCGENHDPVVSTLDITGIGGGVVPHTGFEPVISALRGRCPGPLDECGTGVARRAPGAGPAEMVPSLPESSQTRGAFRRLDEAPVRQRRWASRKARMAS